MGFGMEEWGRNFLRTVVSGEWETKKKSCSRMMFW